MKTGVISEGHAEFGALPLLRDQLLADTGASAIKFLRADFDPQAPDGRIVRACRAALRQLEGRQYDRAIVLLDRESRQTPSSSIADNLQTSFEKANFKIEIRVVVKNRMFENWLVADLSALDLLPARFNVSNAMRLRVEPNRADSADGIQELKRAVIGKSYSKVNDAKAILGKAKLPNLACHSRSFRCFLGRLDHPAFAAGSCSPTQS